MDSATNSTLEENHSVDTSIQVKEERKENESLENADEEGKPQETEKAIDFTKSNYFLKNPQVIAAARGKSVSLFSEPAGGLPDGWRMRTIEREATSSIRHYLA